MKLLLALIIVILIALILFERKRRKKVKENDAVAPRIIGLKDTPSFKHHPQIPRKEPVKVQEANLVQSTWNGTVLTGDGLVASGIASDGDGNLYACGKSFVRKYDPNGAQLWERLDSVGDVTSICVSGQNVYIACDTGDAKIIKLNASTGSEVSSTVVPNCIFGRSQIGADGALYLVGRNSTKNGSLAKLNSTTLAVEWLEISSEPTSEFGETGVVANESYVYLVGWKKFGEVEGTNSDMTLRKFDLDGALIWEKQIGEAGKDTLGVDVGLDGEEIIVTGFSIAGNLTSIFVSRYGADGEVIWTTGNPIGSMKPNWSLPSALEVDASGSTYISGYSKNSNGIQEAFISKYSTVGERLWTKRLASDGGYAYNVSLTLNADTHVAVIGNANQSVDGKPIPVAGHNAYYIVEYTADGTN